MKRILPAPGICLIYICIILFTFTSNAQSPEYVAGELLVRIADGKQPASIIRDIQHIHTHLEFSIKEQITKTMNIWKVEFDPATTSEAYLKNALLNHQDVLIVQRNHIGSFREREPNDPLFTEQWQHRNLGGDGKVGADIKSTKAWEFTTGGITPLGDTIVVAVVDNGFFSKSQ
jgi:serine protease